MANTASAAKRARQAEIRMAQNRGIKSQVKTFKTKALAAVQSGNKEEAEKQFRLFSSAIDRATKSNVVHKNSASRQKSNVCKAIAGIS